jgi:predicted dehydrogenase
MKLETMKPETLTKELKVAIVGTQFMGKAHSNAYLKVPYFFDVKRKPILQLACGVNEGRLKTFANKFGWQHTTTDWKEVVKRDDVDLIDISTPNDTHAPIAIAGAKAGKHLLCEKPIARNVAEARKMYEAAETAGVTHAMIFNYRFVPAIALAKKMIEKGKLGTIRHFNAVYYQDWLVDPKFPITWRHNADASGSGAHGDMNAHIVDLARHLIGEFESVSGVDRTFVKQRPLQGAKGMGEVTTDDAMSFFANFQNGALGSFQCTRFATGRKNFLRLEIFGSEGSLVFNLERLNELEYYNYNDDQQHQGFRNIMVTESVHPYVGNWWPIGHIIGWEHTFVHEVKELIDSIDKKKQMTPSFYDGLKCQEVLEAVSKSAKMKKWINL